MPRAGEADMPQLRKELTLYGLTMVAIGSCIGSGIFLTPAQIAAHLPSPALIILVWTVGGVIALTGALTFAELGAKFPGAGGVYVYLKEGYGELAGFLYGWAYLLVITSGSIAALTIAFATYLAFLIPMSQTTMTVVAALTIVVVTVVNIVHVKAAEVFASTFTGLKLLGIVGLIVVGLVWGDAGTMSAAGSVGEPTGNLSVAFGLALIGVLWSYGGWQHASYVAGETIDPRRTVPRAMILGAAIVAAVYILTNLAYMFLLPVSTIAASESVAADAISTIIPFGGKLMAIIIAISVVGTAGIYTLSAPRIYYAMAADGLFFKKLAEIHPTFRTPVNAILAQSGWAILLLLFWGTFEDLITYVVSVDWVFFAMTGACVFIFRRKAKGEEGGFKTWGYPFTPLIFIGISGLFVLNTFIERPLHAGVGAIFMAIGVGVYFYFKKVRGREPSVEA
jgi:APA family basic amino acid/polyamine antiporter